MVLSNPTHTLLAPTDSHLRTCTLIAALLFCAPALSVSVLGVTTQLSNDTLSHQKARGAMLFAAAPFGPPPKHRLLTQHSSLWQPDRKTQLDVTMLAEMQLDAQLAAATASCARGATKVPSAGAVSSVCASSMCPRQRQRSPSTRLQLVLQVYRALPRVRLPRVRMQKGLLRFDRSALTRVRLHLECTGTTARAIACACFLRACSWDCRCAERCLVCACLEYAGKRCY